MMAAEYCFKYFFLVLSVWLLTGPGQNNPSVNLHDILRSA